MTTIKAGYRLTVKSWENDSDHHKTVVIDGLTDAQARLYTDLLKQLGQSSKLSNLYEPGDVELQRFNQVMSPIVLRHAGTLSGTYEFDANDPEEVLDVASDLLYSLGMTGDDDGRYTRVCESFMVEWVPEDIVLENVTASFTQ